MTKFVWMIAAVITAINLSSPPTEAHRGPDYTVRRHSLDVGRNTGRTNTRCVYRDISERCLSISEDWYAQKAPVAYWEAWDTHWTAQQTIGLMSVFEHKNANAEELKRIAVEKLTTQWSMQDRLKPKVEVYEPPISNKQVMYGLGFLAIGSLIIAVATELEIRASDRRLRKVRDRKPDLT